MDNGLRLSGLATGLDTSSIIEQLMGLERRPVRMMQSNQATIQTKIDRFRALNTKLSALKNAAAALAGSSLSGSPIEAKKATSSNTTYFQASADSTANTGTYTVNIQQLAMEQRTGGGTFTSPAADGVLRITKDSDGTFKDVNLTAGMTIDQVKDAINSAGAGMSASVISGKLVLTGKQSGESFTVDDGDGTGDFAASLGVDSATATYQAAQQAIVEVDGFAVTSKTNQITTALPGVTITAAAVGTATLTIEQDTTQAVDKIKDLVNKYNDIVNQIKEDTKYNAETKKGGPLIGESWVSQLGLQMNQQLTEGFKLYDAGTDTFTTDATFNSYASVGLAVNRDGTISLDDNKLKAALAADAGKVQALFAQEDGATTTSNGQTVKLNTANDGLAKRLEAFADSLISANSQYNGVTASGGRYEGGLLARIKGSEAQIKGFDERIEAYERRLELRERNLRNQFIAMERTVASLRNQGNYFASQMGSMGG